MYKIEISPEHVLNVFDLDFRGPMASYIKKYRFLALSVKNVVYLGLKFEVISKMQCWFFLYEILYPKS